MQAKYPQADFAAYFAFIIACAATPQPGPAHRHHIAPREQFPELAKDATNLISVTVENHKHAHRLLAQCAPELSLVSQAFIDAAIKGGQVGGKIGGRVAGRNRKENGTGIFAANYDWQKQGSKNGKQCKAKGTGIFSMSHKQHQQAGRKAGSSKSGDKLLALAKRSITGKELPVQSIIEMHRQGYTVKEIALAIGNPPNHGQNRIRKFFIREGLRTQLNYQRGQ